VSYAIWRADSPANVSMFDTEEAALASVRRAIEDKGAAFVVGWSLIRAPRRGDWTTIAEGTQLAERAQAVRSSSRRLRRTAATGSSARTLTVP
jgi:hypothetical protein